jgi:uncharacterized repeat protein (TIGR02543 family)
LKTVSIFLITVALIALMVGCGGTTPAKYKLTLVANPVEGGTVNDLTNASPYAAGTGVSIKAVANPGYHFVNWTASAGGFTDTNAAETIFTMPTQNVTITANFVLFARVEGGSGIEEDPYQIVDWYQLSSVRNCLDSYFILVDNLDSHTAGYMELASPTANGGKGWQPIGTFSGSFNGQGYEIRDLFINRPEESLVGLFGVVGEKGVIKNVGVVSASVTGESAVGGLMGQNIGTVSNSYATGNVAGGLYATGDPGGHDPNGFVGGLAGSNWGTVSNSYANCNVSGGYGVGGLVGRNYDTVSDCYAMGNVTSDFVHVGGLVGHNQDGTVSNSYSTSSVTGKDTVGGLVGWNEGIVSNSYANGNVTGKVYGVEIGGLAGANSGNVSNSYANGSVIGGSHVGGLVGRNYGTVSDSYATGSVTGDNAACVGGLVGVTEGGTVSNSFWDRVTSGQATSAGGTGKTTVEMESITTFAAAMWNIIAVASGERNPAYVWNIVDDEAYPFLSWQPVS